MYRQHEGNQIGGTSYSGYLRKRISKMKEQRQVLFDTYRQGKAFLRVFDSQMTKEQRKTATKFAQWRMLPFLDDAIWHCGMVF